MSELLTSHPAHLRLPALIQACLTRRLERAEDLLEILELARTVVGDPDAAP